MKVMEACYDWEMGTAMGVAVLGAVISFRYRAGITPALEEFAGSEGAPDMTPGELHAAGESIEGTMAIARRLGEEGQPLVAPAKEAFLSGLHLAATLSLCGGVIGLVIVLVWMPRDVGLHQTSGGRGADEPGEADEVGNAQRGPGGR